MRNPKVARHMYAKQLRINGLMPIKTNEIDAAPYVLKMLDSRGKIVCGDAMFAQRSLSLLVVQAGGDYLWTVKDNQSQLKTDIEQLFKNDQRCVPGFSPAPTDFATARTVNTGHGRIDGRALTTSSLLAETAIGRALSKYSSWSGKPKSWLVARPGQRWPMGSPV